MADAGGKARQKQRMMSIPPLFNDSEDETTKDEVGSKHRAAKAIILNYSPGLSQGQELPLHPESLHHGQYQGCGA